jgi:hypothetical protein
MGSKEDTLEGFEENKKIPTILLIINIIGKKHI